MKKKYKYIDKCCIQYVQIENIGAVIVTYVGDSTVCTIAVYVTLVPSVRQWEESTVGHVSSFTEFELCVCVWMITGLETADYCKRMNKVFDTQRNQTAQ